VRQLVLGQRVVGVAEEVVEEKQVGVLLEGAAALGDGFEQPRPRVAAAALLVFAAGEEGVRQRQAIGVRTWVGGQGLLQDLVVRDRATRADRLRARFPAAPR
jgi:hypothetical protein